MSRPPSEYTESLRKADPHTSSIFRCPVCLKDFGSAAEASEKLARAHIIAEGLGGKAKTLCCRNCDNTLGGRVEGPFIKWLHTQRVTLAKETGRVRAAVLADGIRLPAHMSFDVNFDFNVRLLKPGDAELFAAAYDLPMEPGPITSPVPPVSMVAYSHPIMTESILQLVCLKTAYLAAFERLGYEYVLRPEFEWVRTALRSPETGPRKHLHTWLVRFDSPHPEWGETEVHLIAAEWREQRSILCLYRLFNIPLLTELPPLAGSSPRWFETQRLPPRLPSEWERTNGEAIQFHNPKRVED